tara:strand:- start:2488 stop:2862 length:375 start_codon:yes stop_codon:yes gene_type:complete
MGSKSSSSTAANQTSTVTNENISEVDGTVFSDTGDIMLTDFNSIDRSFDFAGDGLSAILDFGSGIIDNQQLQLGDTLKSINAANNQTAELSNISADDTLKEIVKYMSIAGAVGFGLWVIYKGLK